MPLNGTHSSPWPSWLPSPSRSTPLWLALLSHSARGALALALLWLGLSAVVADHLTYRGYPAWGVYIFPFNWDIRYAYIVQAHKGAL